MKSAFVTTAKIVRATIRTKVKAKMSNTDFTVYWAQMKLTKTPKQAEKVAR